MEETEPLVGAADGEQEPQPDGPRPARPLARHVLAIMGFLGFANVYAMRVNLSVAIVAMVNNTAIATNASRVNNATCPVAGNTTQAPPDGPFAWGAREQGWLLGAFFFGYVVTQLPGGRAAERWGGKRLYGGGVLVTAVFTLLTPLAAHTSIYLLVLVRVLEGLGEGVTFPVMHALLAVWTPPDERSRMAGFVYSGAQAGTVLSLPVSGMLCDAYGWESVFYVFGVAGVVWWVAWTYLVHDSPASHPRISHEEKNHILTSLADTNPDGPAAAVPWRAIASSGPVWALLVAHVAQNYGFYTLLTELPTYMANVLHFDIKSNSLVSALPYLVMLAVSLLVTPVADKLLAAGADRTTVRKVFNSMAIYLPAGFLVAAAYSGCDTTLTIIMLCLAVGCNGCQYAGFMCCHLDLASNYAGTLLGITNCAANFMGFVAPAVAGYVTDGQSDLPHWRLVFFIAAVVYVAGNTVFLVWGSSVEQPWNLGPRQPPRAGAEDQPCLDQDDY